MENVVAKPLRILSAYFITNETQIPPKVCRIITNQVNEL